MPFKIVAERLTELREKRAEAVDKMRALLDKAEAEGRDVMDKMESAEYDGLEHRADELSGEIKRLEKMDLMEVVQNESTGRLTELQRADGPHDTPGLTVHRRDNGGTARVLLPEHRMADLAIPRGEERYNDLSFGKLLKGAVTGEWANAEAEQRAMGSFLDAQGALLIPTGISNNIWDLARNKSVVFRAGALTVPMDGPKLLLGKLSQDATGYWKRENDDATETTILFDGLELQAKTLFFYMTASRELLADASVLEGQVQNAFAQAAALEIDRVALVGDGGGEEPEGLYNNASVTQTAVSANGVFEDASDVIYRIENENLDCTTFVYSPRTANYIRKRKDGTGQYDVAPEWWRDREHLVSGQVLDTYGGGSDESLFFGGDFSNMVIGVRNQFQVSMTTEGDTLMKAYKAAIAGVMRVDVAVMRPEAFETVTGVLSSWDT